MPQEWTSVASGTSIVSLASSGNVICPLTTHSGRTSTDDSRTRTGFWSFHRVA